VRSSGLSSRSREAALHLYSDTYEAEAARLLAAKLGLPEAEPGLVEELWQVLSLVETDFTVFFRRLADVPIPDGHGQPPISDEALLAPLAEAYYTPAALGGEVRARLNFVQEESILLSGQVTVNESEGERPSDLAGPLQHLHGRLRAVD